MSRSRHRRRAAVNRRTVVGGAALGVLLLSALTLAGSLSSRTTAPAPQPATPWEPGTLSASQPELEQAVLKPADLTSTYKEVPKATVRRLPAPERCSALLDPATLLREGQVSESTGQAAARMSGPTDLAQLLTSFSGDGANATLQQLRRLGEQCRDFQTRLEDGTQVQVRVEETPVDADTYALKLTLSGGGRTTAGYLTLRRAGQVLSVLRQLGSDEAIDPLKLVDLTLDRLTQRR